ncbi:carbohydrate ABC transporter permease [Agromyces sp. NPDC058484]|uniref:carbohydrate ABC transporter permease n=1 Tax=Agromyces sp. NPDC058484 TaxID=3346524 RepID=UPI00365949B8
MKQFSSMSRLVISLGLALGLLVIIVPFTWLLVSSFKPNSEIVTFNPAFFPIEPTWDNYHLLFQRMSFGTFALNSVVVAVVTTVGNLVFCTMCGYALAKLRFRGSRWVFYLVMLTLLVPPVVTLVPLFVLVGNFGLVDTLAGLILPFIVAPIGVFLMRQFIMSIPDEMLEAARIDGAGEWRIFSRIVTPLCLPGLSTLAVLTFLTSWNSLMWPAVVASNEDSYTLPVALALYAVGQHSTNYGLLIAGAVVVVVPMLALFLVLQRYFIQSVATTGLK